MYFCSDPRLEFMMKEHGEDDPDLDQIIAQFVADIPDDKKRERDIRIDISGLPNGRWPLDRRHRRLLFQYKVWQTREERDVIPSYWSAKKHIVMY